jgi:hypothetical protein
MRGIKVITGIGESELPQGYHFEEIDDHSLLLYAPDGAAIRRYTQTVSGDELYSACVEHRKSRTDELK